MNFEPSAHGRVIHDRVSAFLADEIEPVEADYHKLLAAVRESSVSAWEPLPAITEQRGEARDAG